eukprot:gene15242-16816_t
MKQFEGHFTVAAHDCYNNKRRSTQDHLFCIAFSQFCVHLLDPPRAAMREGAMSIVNRADDYARCSLSGRIVPDIVEITIQSESEKVCVIYLNRQKRGSGISVEQNTNNNNNNQTLFTRAQLWNGKDNDSGSGSDESSSGSGFGDSHDDIHTATNHTESMLRITRSMRNEYDQIDASFEQLLGQKDDDLPPTENSGRSNRKRSTDIVAIGSGFEDFGSGDPHASSGFSGEEGGHAPEDFEMFEEKRSLGNKVKNSGSNGVDVSKRSLKSNEGMDLLETFFEMNSDKEFETIRKTSKRDTGETEAVENDTEAKRGDVEAKQRDIEVGDSDKELRMQKRSVEDLGDETIPNLSYIKENNVAETVEGSEEVMKKRDVVDADNSVRFLSDVMTRDLLTDEEEKMIERITRGVKHDGKKAIRARNGGKKVLDAEPTDSSNVIGQENNQASQNHVDNHVIDHVGKHVIEHVMKTKDTPSSRINKRDSLSDLEQPMSNRYDKNDIVKETINGIRSKRQEILDTIPVRAPHFGLLGKRDLILDSDADADILMANAGKTKYDIKEKRFIRTGESKRPDRRYASFVSDKITDLTPLNNEYLDNLKHQNKLMIEKSKKFEADKASLALIGTYAKPTQVSGVWSGLGSEPVFIEKDGKEDENGSGLKHPEQDDTGSGSEMKSTRNRKGSNRHSVKKSVRAEEIGTIMAAYAGTNMPGRDEKKKADEKNKGSKMMKMMKQSKKYARGKRMDKEEDRRYDVDNGNSQVVVAFDEVHEIMSKGKAFIEKPASKPTRSSKSRQVKRRTTVKKVAQKKATKDSKKPLRDWNEDSYDDDDDDDDGSASGDEESGDEKATEKHIRSYSEDDVTVKTLSVKYKPNEEVDKRDLIIVKRAPNDYGYIGCFVDVLSPVRDLSVRAGIPFVTINNCRSACKRTGYYYAGLQFGYLCFCGNVYGKYDMAPDTECNYQCSGNNQQTCGGLWRNSIYSTAGSPDDPKEGPIPIYLSPQENAAPSPSNTTTIGRRSDIPVPANYSNATAPSGYVNYTYPNSQQESLSNQQPTQISTTSQNSSETSAMQSRNQTTIASQQNGGGKRKVLMHFAYLHPQHFDKKIEPTTPPSPTPPLRIEPQTRVFKGEIKLKQKWFDQFRDKMSTKSLILAGNVEQALRNIYTNNTQFHDFLKAEVLSFREGIVNHNPDTVRRVIVEFALTFNQNAISPDARLFSTVRTKNRLDEMPVYAKTLQVSEYRFDPNSPNQAFKVPIKEPQFNISDIAEGDDEKRRKSVISSPNNNNLPGATDPFRQPLTGAQPATQGIQDLHNFMSTESNQAGSQNEATAMTQDQSLREQLDAVTDSPGNADTAVSTRADVPNMEEKRRNVPYILRLFFWKDMLARKKRRTTNDGMPRMQLTRPRRGDVDSFLDEYDGDINKRNNDNEDDTDDDDKAISKENRLSSHRQEPRIGKRSIEKRLRMKPKRKTKDLTTEIELKRSKRTDDSEFDW